MSFTRSLKNQEFVFRSVIYISNRDFKQLGCASVNEDGFWIFNFPFSFFLFVYLIRFLFLFYAKVCKWKRLHVNVCYKPQISAIHSAVARGGAGPPNNYGGNKSINRLEVTTDQCSAFDLDFFSLDNC